MRKTLNIIFFGSSEFSVYVLKEFLKKYKPVLVLTLKGKPKGRGLKIEPNIVFNFCLKEKLNVIEFGSWEKFKEDIRLIKPECGVIAGFGKIIPQEIINLFPKGILNVHPSLLPKYRGPNPIREVILQGEKETGATLFLIDELVDHGPIIKQEKIGLKGDETYLELEEKLGKLGGQILNSVIEDYLKCELIRTEHEPIRTKNCKIQLIPQDEALATYTKKITKEDGLLSFEESYEIWQRKIRALNPWPGTYIRIRDLQILKIFKIKKLDEKNLPQEILKKDVGEFFEIKNDLGLRLKDAFSILEEVQLEGRKRMSGREFLNGFRRLILV
ncbi:MAG: methionyl-tRNA formyltransferase [Candidatus Parcubacteria bacterium]|nr:MAG: methionyl-tRNA formyltransferase [Candidatus Parcubacteria bacterium]